MKNNPFSPGGIVKSNLFGGRVEYIQRILKRIKSVKDGKPACFYFYGERGIGKTALAKLISYISNKNEDTFYNLNFITSYYCAQNHQGFSSVLESSLNSLTDQIEQPLLQKIGSRLGNLFRNGKFTIGAFGGSIEYEYDKKEKISNGNGSITIKDQVVSILKNIIAQIREHDQKGKDGILLVIDEMDKIDDIQIAASVVRGIITELDFRDLGYLTFIFIGYQDSFENFVEGDPSVSRLLDPIYLTEMPDEEVSETFEKGFKEANVTWEKKAMNDNIWMTGGYPLAIQVIGYHLIESDTDNNIDPDDWSRSASLSAEELTEKEFSNFYSFGARAKKNSDKILLSFAIASRFGIESLSLKEIELVSKVKNPRQYVTQLLKNGSIVKDKSNNEYKIRKGLFKRAIVLDLGRSESIDGSHIFISAMKYIQEIKSKRELSKSNHIND